MVFLKEFSSVFEFLQFLSPWAAEAANETKIMLFIFSVNTVVKDDPAITDINTYQASS